MNPEAIYYLLDEWYMGENAGQISLGTTYGTTKTLMNRIITWVDSRRRTNRSDTLAI